MYVYIYIYTIATPIGVAIGAHFVSMLSQLPSCSLDQDPVLILALQTLHWTDRKGNC